MRHALATGLVAVSLWLTAQAATPARTLEEATFGGGCFWCLEAAFEQLKGVDTVVSGYAGGKVPNPTYEAVCSGATGHAEVVRVAYDPAVIGYKDLLRAFFVIHDPTTPNRQGNDVGDQYRSIILTRTPAQVQAAKSAIAELTRTKAFPRPIVTELKPLVTFYRAEEKHQDYFAKHPKVPYCAFVVAPKVEKLRQVFFDRLKR